MNIIIFFASARPYRPAILASRQPLDLGFPIQRLSTISERPRRPPVTSRKLTSADVWAGRVSQNYWIRPPSDKTVTVSKAVRSNHLPPSIYRLPRYANVTSTSCQLTIVSPPRPPWLRAVRHLSNPRGPLTGCHVTR